MRRRTEGSICAGLARTGFVLRIEWSDTFALQTWGSANKYPRDSLVPALRLTELLRYASNAG